ncbi:MAG: HsdM family class I SAM-dependent methyltransferase [Armatimonadota bacterium]|jgi:type I restriction enzyme M protein
MSATRPELGQFFTPRPVIDFALEMLHDLGAPLVGATACDPACGPGEWLRGALRAGAAEALGIDCDPAMIARWRESGLAGDPRCRLLVADGLAPRPALAGSADVVLGNPPFGADLSDLRDSALEDLARHYRLPGLRDPHAHPPSGAGRLSRGDFDRIRRFPTELLFLERFMELCRPGGWVAVVLPEGVFSNARWRHAREWLLSELTVHLVVALPRATFRAHATTARTCLMLVHRRPPAADHRTILCEVAECTPDALGRLRDALSRPGSSAPPLDLTPPVFID